MLPFLGICRRHGHIFGTFPFDGKPYSTLAHYCDSIGINKKQQAYLFGNLFELEFVPDPLSIAPNIVFDTEAKNVKIAATTYTAQELSPPILRQIGLSEKKDLVPVLAQFQEASQLFKKDSLLLRQIPVRQAFEINAREVILYEEEWRRLGADIKAQREKGGAIDALIHDNPNGARVLSMIQDVTTQFVRRPLPPPWPQAKRNSSRYALS
ncbi:MAG: hypothetical protein PHS57_07210 [Alphaproteobacteria bacterium]|nr:hypothetical protein [Alphaproteobacteria bacterium]